MKERGRRKKKDEGGRRNTCVGSATFCTTERPDYGSYGVGNVHLAELIFSFCDIGGAWLFLFGGSINLP